MRVKRFVQEQNTYMLKSTRNWFQFNFNVGVNLQVFFCVVFYGLFHGLCYLPVTLSLIGPSPYDSSQIHPEQNVLPSQSNHCLDGPDSNADCEMNNNLIGLSRPNHSSNVHPEPMVLPLNPGQPHSIGLSALCTSQQAWQGRNSLPQIEGNVLGYSPGFNYLLHRPF